MKKVLVLTSLLTINYQISGMIQQATNNQDLDDRQEYASQQDLDDQKIKILTQQEDSLFKHLLEDLNVTLKKNLLLQLCDVRRKKAKAYLASAQRHLADQYYDQSEQELSLQLAHLTLQLALNPLMLVEDDNVAKISFQKKIERLSQELTIFQEDVLFNKFLTKNLDNRTRQEVGIQLCDVRKQQAEKCLLYAQKHFTDSIHDKNEYLLPLPYGVNCALQVALRPLAFVQDEELPENSRRAKFFLQKRLEFFSQELKTLTEEHENKTKKKPL